MNVLFFAPYACAIGHHETDLELAITHLRQGDTVHVIQCRREMPICDQNPEHKMLSCLNCTSTFNRSFSRLGIPPERIYGLDSGAKFEIPVLPTFNHIQELKTYRVRGIEGSGLSVASSLITHLEDSAPDTIIHAEYIRKMLTTFVLVYENIRRHLEIVKPDVFYVFNARVAPLHAAFRAARSLGVKTIVTDRDKINEYLLLDNHTPTDFQFNLEQGRGFARRFKEDPHGEVIGAEWFERNPRSNTRQKSGKLPADFNPSKRNIAFFGSSECEVGLCPERENVFYKSHRAALEHLLNAVRGTDIHIHFRPHPLQVKDMSDFSHPNLTMIPNDSEVDSYALLEACEKTFSLGSTLSIESIYWGRPSICAGRAFFEELEGACYHPRTKEEIISLVKAKLPAPDPKAALPYGYWLQKRGYPMRYVTPHNPREGQAASFGSTKICAPLSVRALLRLTHFNRKPIATE